MGSASRWWLHHSLSTLHKTLAAIGIPLHVKQGDAKYVVPQVSRDIDATHIHWNRRYEPAGIATDTYLKSHLRDETAITVTSFAGNLLAEPWTVLKADQSPYKVFTPYWKQYLARGLDSAEQSDALLPAPDTLSDNLKPAPDTVDMIQRLGLLPPTQEGNWEAGLAKHWQPGEAGALIRLRAFSSDDVENYAERRDFPAIDATTGLSPHLHFGELSPRQIRHYLANIQVSKEHQQILLRQLAWRDFAHYVLFHFPDTARQPFNEKYKQFPYINDAKELNEWQRGQTGIPIIDAGMRELWATGIMHNRVRMLVGSLLTKNLCHDWRTGAAWFWDTLVDADLANNQMGWQWVAGCGVDAAPYFRIFNPVTQSQKFDKEGAYIRRWVPELTHVPSKWIHAPWECPEHVRLSIDLKLGTTAECDYPLPMIDLGSSRKTALDNHRAFMGNQA